MVDDISHEGLRVVLREEGVSFQVIKTGKQSNDADFEAKKNRILELYAIADGKADAGPGDPTVVFCMASTAFLAFVRYPRSFHPPEIRIAIVLDNFSPHLATKADQRVAEWAAANNVELASTPTYSSWLNRIEAQFQALRYFALDGTDHNSHTEQASMIRRYIIWRNRNAHDQALRELVKRANVA
jgi:transposase